MILSRTFHEYHLRSIIRRMKEKKSKKLHVLIEKCVGRKREQIFFNVCSLFLPTYVSIIRWCALSSVSILPTFLLKKLEEARIVTVPISFNYVSSHITTEVQRFCTSFYIVNTGFFQQNLVREKIHYTQ